MSRSQLGGLPKPGYNESVLNRCFHTDPALTTAPVQEETVAPTKLNPPGEGPQSLRRNPCALNPKKERKPKWKT